MERCGDRCGEQSPQEQEVQQRSNQHKYSGGDRAADRIVDLCLERALLFPGAFRRRQAQHRRHDVLGIVVEALVAMRQRFFGDDAPNVLGQLVLLRGCRADEDRHEEPLSRQRRAKLSANIVVRLEIPWLAALRRLFEPFFADEHERRVAVAEVGRDPLRDVIAAAERAHVEEHVRFGKQAREAIVDPAGGRRCVLASPVTDEDFLGHGASLRDHQAYASRTARRPAFSRSPCRSDGSRPHAPRCRSRRGLIDGGQRAGRRPATRGDCLSSRRLAGHAGLGSPRSEAGQRRAWPSRKLFAARHLLKCGRRG